MPAPLSAKSLDVFVPAQDHALSLAYYKALGFHENWSVAGLSELQLGNARFLLQDFYKEDLASNLMLRVTVDDAQAWFEHIQTVLNTGDFPTSRVRPPQDENHGHRVTYAWDPSGVLLHLSQPL